MKKKQNSAKYWNDLYINNETAWDLSGPSQPFLDLKKSINFNGKKICIPGCGNGHDVIELAKAGSEVWAIDFASKPLENIRNHPEFNNLIIHLIELDFFHINNSFVGKFDFVFEYTFFCAIDPLNRKKYRDLIYQILKNGGKFISLFFPILKPEEESGPPYGVNLDKTLKLFKKKFNLILLQKNIHSSINRKGNEILAIMEKNG
tara:strand:- start:2430 stop:3041 length:612 start_codon:yes stop_codon:yes gene_type:complete